MLYRIYKLFRSFFYPERCPYCYKRIEYNKIACDECRGQFPKTYSINYAKGGYICCSPFFYQGIFADAIKRLKFNQFTQSSEKLAAVLEDCVRKSYSIEEIDLITFVPMHRKDYSDRGYNQAELLAKDLARKLKITCEKTLIKHKRTAPQHECLSSAKRRDNVKGAYKVIEKKKPKLKGKTILVIDDILTTGYTMGECCKTLEKCSNSRVICATVCAKNDIYT